MCGIIGYTGPLEAKTILLDGLESLEYRGYDSAGIGYFDGKGQVHIIKSTGKTAHLRKLAASHMETPSHCGIGHTRWATHGSVTRENAHPHQFGDVTLIHNGIIENYPALIRDYGLKGRLISQTDSEVGAAVLDTLYRACGRDPLTALRDFSKKITGSYAFCILFSDRPGELYAMRSVSPLLAACTPLGSLAASDLTALLAYTKTYFVVPEGYILRLTPGGAFLYDRELNRTEPVLMEADWDMGAAMKNGYPHFMLKEIHEQPEALKKTILPRIREGLPDFSGDGVPDSLFLDCQAICIVACGTAMHAGLAARALMEPLLGIPVTVSVASEFRYEEPLVGGQTLTIAISQSGETTDTLAALRLAKSLGSRTLAVVNVKGSAIARESGHVLYTHAGPEIAVASTKAYCVQLALLYLAACRMAYVRGQYTAAQAKEFVKRLLEAAPAIHAVLCQEERIKALSSHLLHASDAFFIGRGLDYAAALEGALKLKEISYIHAEAYAAGELKHGAIALIAPGVPLIAAATQESVLSKTLSNIREAKARGAFVILIAKEDTAIEEGMADAHLSIPSLPDIFAIFPAAAFLQLIAYYVSAGKNLDVDQPRNLAKSVTVE